MKTQKQFNKENIAIALIYNLPMLIVLTIPFIGVLKISYIITIMLLLNVNMTYNSLRNWYNDYRFNELEKEVEKLKNKHGNII